MTAVLQFLVDFRRPAMVPKTAIAAALCTGLLMSGGVALADEYRAGELFSLDPSSALLSPKRLGPETQFAPVRIEARTDRKPVKTERVVVRRTTEREAHVVQTPERKAHVARQSVEKPRGAVSTKLTRGRSNPLDAQARDTRIQTWPCRSGGICDWQR
jgi:hypothetical protein